MKTLKQLQKLGMDEIYKYLLQNIPIHKVFETPQKRQIIFNYKNTQFGFEKVNGEIITQIIAYKKFNFSEFPKLEYKFNIPLYHYIND